MLFFSILDAGFILNAKRAMVLAVALILLTLAFAGCLGSGGKVDNTQDVSDDAIPSSPQTPDSSSVTRSELPTNECQRPWPSRIDMIQIPDSMVTGQTYIFKAQLFVQNFDANCNASPWWYGVDAPITWTFSNGNGITVINHTKSCSVYGIAKVAFLCPEGGLWTAVAHWLGNDNYAEAEGRSIVPATPADECFTNLGINGPYDLGTEAPYWSGRNDAIADPFWFNSSELSQVQPIIKNNHYYYMRLSADALQAYVDRMLQAGWGANGVDRSAIAAVWVMEISAPGILPSDVVVFAGEGNSTEGGRMDLKSFTQMNDTTLATVLDTAPYERAISLMTGDPNLTSMHAEVPSLVNFQKPGNYAIAYYLIDQTTKVQISPQLRLAANVSKAPAQEACEKPWPSKLEILSQPESMTVGQAYTFQTRTTFQDFDGSCNPTPWYGAAKLSVAWSFSSDQGEELDYECMTTIDGTCSVDFQCPSLGVWTVTAQWAGNGDYQGSSVSVTIVSS